MSKCSASVIPSLSLDTLKGVLGKRVVSLNRYSWWPKEDVATECGELENSSAFSLTYGPLGIAFENGTVIGVAEEPSLNSVVIWVDRMNGADVRHPAMDEDPDLFKISATDSEFAGALFGQLIGDKLIALAIVKPRSMNALLSALPSEVGLCFSFESGKKFIAGRGLHREGGDFALIEYEKIPELTKLEIIEEPMFKT